MDSVTWIKAYRETHPKATLRGAVRAWRIHNGELKAPGHSRINALEFAATEFLRSGGR